jgi:hypothetical protein
LCGVDPAFPTKKERNIQTITLYLSKIVSKRYILRAPHLERSWDTQATVGEREGSERRLPTALAAVWPV